MSRRNTQILDDSLRSAESARELAQSNHAVAASLAGLMSLDNPLAVMLAFQTTLDSLQKAQDPEDRQLLQGMKQVLAAKFTAMNRFN